MEEPVVETLFICGKSVLHAALILNEDGGMVIRDEAGSEFIVDKSFTPQKAREVLRDMYVFARDNLLDEYSWNEREKVDAALQGRKANRRDEARLIFWGAIEKCLGAEGVR